MRLHSFIASAAVLAISAVSFPAAAVTWNWSQYSTGPARGDAGTTGHGCPASYSGTLNGYENNMPSGFGYQTEIAVAPAGATVSSLACATHAVGGSLVGAMYYTHGPDSGWAPFPGGMQAQAISAVTASTAASDTWVIDGASNLSRVYYDTAWHQVQYPALPSGYQFDAATGLYNDPVVAACNNAGTCNMFLYNGGTWTEAADPSGGYVQTIEVTSDLFPHGCYNFRGGSSSVYGTYWVGDGEQIQTYNCPFGFPNVLSRPAPVVGSTAYAPLQIAVANGDIWAIGMGGTGYVPGSERLLELPAGSSTWIDMTAQTGGAPASIAVGVNKQCPAGDNYYDVYVIVASPGDNESGENKNQNTMWQATPSCSQ